MTIRELIVDLGVDADNAALNRFDRGVQSAKKAMLAAAKAAAGFAAAIGGVTAAAFKATQATTEYGDRVAKDAERAGVSAEELQKLEFAFERNGAAAESAEKSIGKLNKRAQKAAVDGAGPAADTFKRLGVQLTNANGEMRTSREIFLDSVDALGEVENQAERSAMAQQIFGKSGRDLLPLIEAGSDAIEQQANRAEELGAVMSNETAAASEGFQDSLLDLKVALRGVRNALGAELIPVFEDAIDRVTEWISENRDLIDSGLENFALLINAIMDRIVGTLQSVNAQVQELGGWPDVLRDVWDWTKTLTQAVLSGAAAWWTYSVGAGAAAGAASGIAAAIPAMISQIVALAGVLWSGGIPAVTAFASGVWAAISPALPFVAAAAAVAAAVWELWNVFVEGESALVSWMESFEWGRTIINGVTGVLSGLWEWIHTVAGAISTLFAPVWRVLKTAALTALQPVIGAGRVLGEVLGVAFENIKFAGRLAFHIIATAAEWAFGWISSMVQSAVEFITPILSEFADWFASITRPIRDAWTSVFDWILDKVQAFAAGMEWLRNKLANLVGMEVEDQQQDVEQNVNRNVDDSDDGDDPPGDGRGGGGPRGGGGSAASVFEQDRQQRKREQARREFARATAPTRETEQDRQQRAAAAREQTIEAGDTTIENLEINEAGDPERTRQIVEEELNEHEKRKLRKLREMQKGGEV